MTKKTFGDVEIALTTSIFAQIKQLSQKTQQSSDNDAIEPCCICGFRLITLVQMPSYCVHYAVQRSTECDTFRVWKLEPLNQEDWQWQQIGIPALLKYSRLIQWKCDFLLGLLFMRLLFPQWRNVIFPIAAKAGGMG